MTTTYGDAANEGNEHRRAQLTDDGQEMDKFVECVYRERLATEKVWETRERRVLKVQATLEVAEAASTEEKAANKSEQEVQETHQLMSNEAVKKVPMQSRFLESGSVELNRAKDSIELQRSEDLSQWLAKRDGWLTNLRVCQEQLRHSFQKWEKISQPEKEEVVTATKASELKAEEPSEKLRELETYLTRLKEQTSNLEERCIPTETKAGESSSLPCQLQTKTKLDYATTELSEAKDMNSEIDAMKLRLEVCQKELSHALILGALAENSLSELKLREEHMEEVDQSKKELEERLRWRNEQFQSLEEAHAKLRIQVKEKSSEWDTEKSALFSDIDSLHSSLDLKGFFLRELQKQLQMVHHALSCEESRRKALELETAKSSQGLLQATAGYKEAQTTLETLRVQLSAEIGTLRNALGAKDRQLKDLHVNFVHMEQEYKELKEIEKEYRAWASNPEEQQQQLLSMKEEISGVVEAHDNLRSRMKALEIDSGRERRGLVKALDQAHDHLSLRDETLKEADSELVRVKIALEHAQGNSSCLDIQLKQCEAQLEGACEEATTARRALASLENSIYVEKSFLLESLLGKDKVIQDLKAQIHSMDQTISELSMHEEEHLLMQRDYEELQRQEIQRDAGRKSLESIHNSVLLRVSQEENAWLADRKTLFAELQATQERANAVEKQFHEVHRENERHLDAIRKLEARCAFHDKDVAQHCLLTDQTKEQLALERTEVENEMIEARTMNESLSAASSKKDVTVERLKDRIENLEAGLRRKDEEACRHNERVSHAEKELRETAEVLCNMEEQIALIESQACKTATERKLSEDVRTNLEEVTRKCQQSLAAKADLDGKLEVARRDLSVLSMQLTAVNQELLDVSCEKELALNDLDTKESFLTKLTLEHKTLLADRGSLEQVVQVLQIKKGDLVQEVESSRATIKQLCNKYEAAQSSLASSVNEVKDLEAKLQNAHIVRVQLLKAEEQNRDLEGYLKAAKAIAQDKEEKLAASEWTVQQLALDIGKAKAVLTQKDREDALMRDELADVERQLRAKEGAFIEMECYLEDALLSRVSMQREIDQLRQQMEDLDRGAADWKRKEQDMAIQLQVVGAALEEKRASLVARELEIKSGNDLREVMDGAIDSLKLQLADEQTALSAQQKDMNRLCEDFERSKSEASSASRLVKDLQGKLQQLEHSGAVRINQFQSSLSELRDELSVAHHQLDKYQDRTRLFMEKASRYKEKFETLLDLHTRRDSSLKDLEAQLFSARAGALDQSKMLERRDQDLQRAKEQRERQDQRQISLEDSLSRIQSQRCELQLGNEKLLLELRKLSVQLGVSSTEVALKSKDIQSLHIQLEQTRLLGAQEGERQTLMTTLVDEVESPQAFQEPEGCLRAVQSSLHVAQEQRQVLQRNLVGKEGDMEIFVEKLSTAEKRCEVPEELSKLQEALTVAHRTLATAEGKVVSLKIQLEDAEERRFRCHQEVEQVNEAMIRVEYDLIEESGNVLGFTLLEHALNDEMTKVVESTSLIRDVQAQAEAWTDVAVDPQGDKLKQEVLLIHEALKLVDHGWFEDDLLDERMKAAEFAALNLQLQVEGWKCRAEDAAKEGERVNQELKCAGSTISSLVVQIETHQRVEHAMKELIDSLQVEMNVARKVAYARRGKMENFLHELEQSQDGEKELLENLQMEQKRLITDVVDDGGFDCTFDIDAYLKMPIQGPGNVHNISAAKYGIRDDGIRPKFHLEEFQNSAECSFGTVNEALENELENLRLHAEESQRQAQEVCGKLDAALSDVATKNLIIKQMNDEISSLKFLLKRVEQGTMSVGDSLHGERHKYSTDTSILTTGRDDRQQSTSPGKRKAEIQEELNNYLDLCGSLVRKIVRLEKQLDGLQRKNRGLQMQVEGFQLTGTSSLDKERRAVDPVDCSTELILLGFSRKTYPSVFKPDFQERRMVSLQNICTGNVLGEIDENAEPGSSERCPMKQKPPVSRRPAMQLRKQNA